MMSARRTADNYSGSLLVLIALSLCLNQVQTDGASVINPKTEQELVDAGEVISKLHPLGFRLLIGIAYGVKFKAAREGRKTQVVVIQKAIDAAEAIARYGSNAVSIKSLDLTNGVATVAFVDPPAFNVAALNIYLIADETAAMGYKEKAETIRTAGDDLGRIKKEVDMKNAPVTE